MWLQRAFTITSSCWMKVRYFPLKKQRNEFGKRIRKDYEAHRLTGIRRKDIKELVPMADSIARTITTVVTDNLMLEIYD